MYDNLGLEQMNYTSIKEYISSIEKDYEFLLSEKCKTIIKELTDDKRKNVQNLGNKLIKLIDAYNNEVKRVKAMYDFDKSFGTFKYVAGVDEVGRGPLAGPIVSAAVILDLDYLQDKDLILKINDSKKISAKLRAELSEIIKEKAIAYSIVLKDNTEIDEKGIGWCNNQIFIDACADLKLQPDLVLSDGYAIKNFSNRNEFVIKGDTKSASIACASILAKVYRDNLMTEYANKYPQYGFEKNVGYGTEEHVKAIKEYGVTEIHRISFLKNIIE